MATRPALRHPEGPGRGPNLPDELCVSMMPFRAPLRPPRAFFFLSALSLPLPAWVLDGHDTTSLVVPFFRRFPRRPFRRDLLLLRGSSLVRTAPGRARAGFVVDRLAPQFLSSRTEQQPWPPYMAHWMCESSGHAAVFLPYVYPSPCSPAFFRSCIPYSLSFCSFTTSPQAPAHSPLRYTEAFQCSRARVTVISPSSSEAYDLPPPVTRLQEIIDSCCSPRRRRVSSHTVCTL